MPAFFAFNSTHTNLPFLLEIPSAIKGVDTNSLPAVSVVATNGTNLSSLQTNLVGTVVDPDRGQSFFGPVQILMRSDKEILFFVGPTSIPTNSTRVDAKMIKTDSLHALGFAPDN